MKGVQGDDYNALKAGILNLLSLIYLIFKRALKNQNFWSIPNPFEKRNLKPQSREIGMRILTFR